MKDNLDDLSDPEQFACMVSWCLHIKHERLCLTTFETLKTELFGHVVKHCLECLIYLINRKTKEKTKK